MIHFLRNSIYIIRKPKIDFDAVKSIVLVIAFLYGINALFGFVEGLIMVHVANNYSRKVPWYSTSLKKAFFICEETSSIPS